MCAICKHGAFTTVRQCQHVCVRGTKLLYTTHHSGGGDVDVYELPYSSVRHESKVLRMVVPDGNIVHCR